MSCSRTQHGDLSGAGTPTSGSEVRGVIHQATAPAPCPHPQNLDWRWRFLSTVREHRSLLLVQITPENGQTPKIGDREPNAIGSGLLGCFQGLFYLSTGFCDAG